MAYNKTRVQSGDSADNFVPEMWGNGVQNYIAKKFVLANLTNDVSFMLKGAGDTINIPRVTENTATTTTISSFGASTATVNYISPTDGLGTLTVTEMAYYARIYPDITEIQANPDMLGLHTEAMGFALGKAIETYVCSLYKTYSANFTEHSIQADSAVDKAELGLLLQTLHDNGIDPADGYVMAVHPNVVADLAALEVFTSADYVKDQFIYKTGLLGSLFGMPVYVSNEFGTGTPSTAANTVLGCIFKPSNVFLAYSQKPKMVSQYSVDFLGHKVATHTYYGGLVAIPKQLVQITNP